jgi:hypothetical protein
MTHFETMHEEVKEGFTIHLSVAPEDMEPDWDFESEEDRQEIFRKINNGTLAYFVAKVTASKNGIELSSDYLGGCCYDSVEQFVKDNDYYADMVDRCISEAEAAIEALTA